MITNLATHPTGYVTVPDLVRYLVGIPRSTVYWHIQYGKLPVRRIGRTVRIKTQDARDWAELYANPRLSG